MRNKIIQVIVAALCWLPIIVWAADTTISPTSTAQTAEFTVGKDYQVITPLTIPGQASIVAEQAKNKVLVQEFFNYGCPWCFRFEPTLEKWLKNKPKDVVFERVPVVFESGWQVLARTYYIAKAFDLTHTFTPAIFNAIHQQGQDLTDEAKMAAFFAAHGVPAEKFTQAYNHSPAIDLEMKQADELMQQYGIYEIPTIVIDGKYLVSMRLMQGNDQRFIAVLNYLVQKEQKSLVAENSPKA